MQRNPGAGLGFRACEVGSGIAARGADGAAPWPVNLFFGRIAAYVLTRQKAER
jgi:hypothetical protein